MYGSDCNAWNTDWAIGAYAISGNCITSWTLIWGFRQSVNPFFLVACCIVFVPNALFLSRYQCIKQVLPGNPVAPSHGRRTNVRFKPKGKGGLLPGKRVSFKTSSWVVDSTASPDHVRNKHIYRVPYTLRVRTFVTPCIMGWLLQPGGNCSSKCGRSIWKVM